MQFKVYMVTDMPDRYIPNAINLDINRTLSATAEEELVNAQTGTAAGHRDIFGEDLKPELQVVGKGVSEM